MGAAAGPVGAGLSLASLGFGAMSDLKKGQGEAAGQTFMAARADRAAQIGRIKADQTDTTLREQLSTTLANIDAVRAAANVDPSSPTGFAIGDQQRRISDRERTNRVLSLRLQADEDTNEALYRRGVASDAIGASRLAAGGRVLKGLGSLASNYK